MAPHPNGLPPLRPPGFTAAHAGVGAHDMAGPRLSGPFVPRHSPVPGHASYASSPTLPHTDAHRMPERTSIGAYRQTNPHWVALGVGVPRVIAAAPPHPALHPPARWKRRTSPPRRIRHTAPAPHRASPATARFKSRRCGVRRRSTKRAAGVPPCHRAPRRARARPARCADGRAAMPLALMTRPRGRHPSRPARRRRSPLLSSRRHSLPARCCFRVCSHASASSVNQQAHCRQGRPAAISRGRSAKDGSRSGARIRAGGSS